MCAVEIGPQAAPHVLSSWYSDIQDTNCLIFPSHMCAGEVNPQALRELHDVSMSSWYRDIQDTNCLICPSHMCAGEPNPQALRELHMSMFSWYSDIRTQTASSSFLTLGVSSKEVLWDPELR